MRSKKICFICSLYFLSLAAYSQTAIPADAESFYTKAMSSINARHITWIKRTATTANNQKIDEAGIRKLAAGYATQNNFNEMDIEALVSLIMMQAAKDQEQDLKNTMAELKKKNEEKQKLREAQALMEKNKNEMSRQKLDSFKQITNLKVNTVTTTPTTRVQTIQPSPKVNTQANTQVSATEIKQVQDSLKSKLDSMNEMSEMTSLRLQMMMDRRSKFISTLSNIMKKISDTQSAIIQNMK